MSFSSTGRRRSAAPSRRAGQWWWRPDVLVAAWAATAVACLQIPPRWAWPLLFGGLTLPGALVAAVALLVLALLRGRWQRAVLPALVLALTWSYWQRGLALRPPLPAEPPVRAAGSTAPAQLRVLSYNVRIFNTYAALSTPGFANADSQIAWVARHPADIICLQEYYNQKNETPGRDRTRRIFGATRRISKARKGRFVSVTLENPTQQFGMAIFSTGPLVRHGTISFGELRQNHAMWADVRLPGRDGPSSEHFPAYDTVRVFNVHFQSMSLDEDRIVRTARQWAWLDAAGLQLLRRFRHGAVTRSWQVDTLAGRIARSPYPVVVCGDFNDPPYSYTYQKLARRLLNAHQAIGSGIGATYNGKLPLLRIDNQFSTPTRLTPVWLHVHREVPYSDHFPLDVVYERH